MMTKKAYFYIDDTIWVLRDLTKTMPASLFDVPLLKALKTAHDKYGVKTQLNLFYRTDSFYGYDEFSLKDVTDAYKKEWEEASSWLKFAFHAKEEFPDYPHVNARYDDVYRLFKDIEREVFRFAGEKSFTYGVCPHWLPVSEEGVRALYDCNVRIMDCTFGDVTEYDGNPESLPYGHAARLLNNRQKETKIFTRYSPDVAIERSVCAYNHISEENFRKTRGNFEVIHDEKTGMNFKVFCAICLNLVDMDTIEKTLEKLKDNQYVGLCFHEQYFYEDYFAYQSDYAEKIYKTGEILGKNGFEWFYIEEMMK